MQLILVVKQSNVLKHISSHEAAGRVAAANVRFALDSCHSRFRRSVNTTVALTAHTVLDVMDGQ